MLIIKMLETKRAIIRPILIVFGTYFFFFRPNDLYFLECDVGQSEFTPPGLISLNRVSSPVLGLYMQ